MAEAVSEITRSLEQLNERIAFLENRVSALEGGPAKQMPVRPILEAPDARSSRPPETWQGFPPIEMPTMVSTLGKSVVGLAGAYLLRATAESGTLPRVVVIMAVLYAALWMVWAVRANRDRFTSVTYGITSLLILSPMLWESTVLFHFASPAFSGAILVQFFVIAIALSWRRKLLAIPWLAAAACTVTALSLIVATHDLVPLTMAILAIALIVEVSGCFGRLMSVRAIAAAAADIAVLLVVDLLASNVPEGYRPASAITIIAAWFTLMAIYVGSLGIRSFWLKRRITIIDVGQGMLCVVIAGFGAVRSSQNSVLIAFGIGLLVMATACYWGALAIFSGAAYARNRRVFAIWAPVLLIGASAFLFSGDLRVLVLCIASLTTALGYTRTGNVTLGIHTSVFLAAGAATSSLPDYVMNALAGTVPAAPGWSALVTATTAALCYCLGSHTAKEKTSRRILWVFPAALLIFFGVAMAVAGITWFAAGRIDVSASRLSVIRTILNCGAALSLAFLAIRSRRVELGWLAYTAIAFGTLKLLFEDLRYGNAASLVLSFLFYGLALIVLPRVIRQGHADYVAPRANSVSA